MVEIWYTPVERGTIVSYKRNRFSPTAIIPDPELKKVTSKRKHKKMPPKKIAAKKVLAVKLPVRASRKSPLQMRSPTTQKMK